MKVRVKQGQRGFIYGTLRRDGQEFTLVPVECKTEKDAKGKPAIISVEAQFSDNWMEKVEVKRGPKPRQEKPEAEK